MKERKIADNPITTDMHGAMSLFGFGRSKMIKKANEAGAVIVLNDRCKRYSVRKIQEYLERLGGIE